MTCQWLVKPRQEDLSLVTWHLVGDCLYRRPGLPRVPRENGAIFILHINIYFTTMVAVPKVRGLGEEAHSAQLTKTYVGRACVGVLSKSISPAYAALTTHSQPHRTARTEVRATCVWVCSLHVLKRAPAPLDRI